jgi:glycosyltransferase involved in cell wall biosynthesis
MTAPTLGQILTKGRADISSVRLPALYYWISQQLSLRWYRRTPGSVVTYSHPAIVPYATRFGFRKTDMWYVSNGSDAVAADRVPDQPKQFDLVWAGRMHPQKGVDDLLATMKWLKQKLPDFRAIIIGKSRDALEPIVKQTGLSENVAFSGLVSEEEKFRLFKSSRLFVMPSRYESWGIVVGEALVSGVPVVAYKLDCYPPVFGDFIRYVKPFDREEFQRAVEDEIRRQRAGKNYLATMDWQALKERISWTASQKSLCALLERLR